MADFEQALVQQINELLQDAMSDEKLLTDINQVLAETYDPYVPYVTGALAHNITVDANGITYNQPYAEEVYESHNFHNQEYHPLATSHWDEVAYANHKDEIAVKVEEIIAQWIKTKQS